MCDYMNIIDKINNICEDNTTLYGYASIEDYQNYMVDELKGYSHAIVIGINIPDKIIDKLDTSSGELEYRNSYNKINERLNHVTKAIEKSIIEEGYDAKAVNASYIIPDGKLYGELSHKMIANLAGLGWIGKSCLLITPHYGPRVRWATILTNLDLQVTNNPTEPKCGNCNLCVVNCPAGAFSGVAFNENDPRESRYDAFKCSKHFDELEKMGRPRLCGLCVKVCPWGLVNKNNRTKEDIIKL